MFARVPQILNAWEGIKASSSHAASLHSRFLLSLSKSNRSTLCTLCVWVLCNTRLRLIIVHCESASQTSHMEQGPLQWCHGLLMQARGKKHPSTCPGQRCQPADTEVGHLAVYFMERKLAEISFLQSSSVSLTCAVWLNLLPGLLERKQCGKGLHIYEMAHCHSRKLRK